MVVVFTWFAAVSILVFGKILLNCGVLDCCHIMIDLVLTHNLHTVKCLSSYPDFAYLSR